MTKARDLANGATALSAVSPTELGYLDGVTSAVQTQLDNKVDETGGSVISANSSGNALEIRQTGAGNALVVEDAANPDSSPFTIDANGLVWIGNTTDPAGITELDLVVSSDSGAGANIVARKSSTTSFGANVTLLKSAGTNSTPTVIGSTDVLGGLNYYGYDGTNYTIGAQITSAANGAVSTGIVPGSLTMTTYSTSGTANNALMIDSAGSVTINAAAGFPFTGSAAITGSLTVTGSVAVSGSLIITGSVRATQGFTGSLFGTSSLDLNSTNVAISGAEFALLPSI